MNEHLKNLIKIFYIISKNQGPTVIDPSAAPVKIIAEVFQGRGPGGNPVIGAKVKYVISKILV